MLFLAVLVLLLQRCVPRVLHQTFLKAVLASCNVSLSDHMYYLYAFSALYYYLLFCLCLVCLFNKREGFTDLWCPDLPSNSSVKVGKKGRNFKCLKFSYYILGVLDFQVRDHLISEICRCGCVFQIYIYTHIYLYLIIHCIICTNIMYNQKTRNFHNFTIQRSFRELGDSVPCRFHSFCQALLAIFGVVWLVDPSP